jgi:hypothetical protein
MKMVVIDRWYNRKHKISRIKGWYRRKTKIEWNNRSIPLDKSDNIQLQWRITGRRSVGRRVARVSFWEGVDEKCLWISKELNDRCVEGVLKDIRVMDFMIGVLKAVRQRKRAAVEKDKEDKRSRGNGRCKRN